MPPVSPPSPWTLPPPPDPRVSSSFVLRRLVRVGICRYGPVPGWTEAHRNHPSLSQQVVENSSFQDLSPLRDTRDRHRGEKGKGPSLQGLSPKTRVSSSITPVLRFTGQVPRPRRTAREGHGSPGSCLGTDPQGGRGRRVRLRPQTDVGPRE